MDELRERKERNRIVRREKETGASSLSSYNCLACPVQCSMKTKLTINHGDLDLAFENSEPN